jgi:Zn-dependent protease with chaperone function
VAYLTFASTGWVLSSGISLNAFTLIVYAAPPVAGSIVTLFLLKPMVIRPPRPPAPLRLDPAGEPALFQFIAGLCDALGAPHPSRVYVDLNVNAFAALRGWRGFFLGDLDLTIGLPLARDFTLPQFTGVLAHEFGHFSQHTGLRSWFLIQRIQLWFARVVHQRDACDRWLDRMRARRDYRIKAVAGIAALAVKASRKYLEWLMKAGQWLGSAFSRHMEYDADACEASIVGVEVFESALRRLPVLTVGSQIAWQVTQREWSNRRLPADFVALVASRTNSLPADVTSRIVETSAASKTGRWDTHPSTEDRIAGVRCADLPGIFWLDGPAARLFGDLPGLCRLASEHHFKKALGAAVESAVIVPEEETVLGAAALQELEKAHRQLFNAAPEFCAPWFRLPDVSLDPATTPYAKPEYDAARYDELTHTDLLQFSARTLSEKGVKIKPDAFRVSAGDWDTVRQEHATTALLLTRMEDAFRKASAGAGARIAAAARFYGRAGKPEFCTAWDCFAALAEFHYPVREIKRHLAAASVVRANAPVISAATCAILLDALESFAVSQINLILAKVDGTRACWILDHRAEPTLAAQLRPQLTTRTESIQVFVSRFDGMAARALANVSWLTLAAGNAENGRELFQIAHTVQNG